MDNTTVKTLTDQYAERQAERRAGAVKLYRELLLRSDSPKPDDADKLHDCMVTLGRTPEDLLTDQALVTRIRQYEQLAPNVENLQAEHQRAHVAWTEAKNAGDEALRKLQAKIDADLERLDQARRNTQARLGDAQHARSGLSRLQDEWEAIVQGVSVEKYRAMRREELAAVAPPAVHGRSVPQD